MNTTINEKLLITDHEIDIYLPDLNKYSFDEIIQYFTKLKIEHKNEITKIIVDNKPGEPTQVFIRVYRWETDQEYNKRIKKIQQQQMKQIKKDQIKKDQIKNTEYLEYLRLKKKFENK